VSAGSTQSPAEADLLQFTTEGITARAGGENFPVAMRALTKDQRRHLFAIYRFARLTDQIGDVAHGDRLKLLDEFQRQLDAAIQGEPAHPVLQLLAPSIRELSLPLGPFHRLIEANRLDQVKKRCATYQELIAYCDLSANPVGELVLHVFGVATEQRVLLSDAVCTGLQLVEHWQDVAEDYADGRIYLPTEDLEKFGCQESDLAAAEASDRLRKLLRFECERAHALFDQGIPLVGSLRGRARMAICGFVAGGRAALDAIARRSYNTQGGAPAPLRRDFLRRYATTWIAASSAAAKVKQK
jgi:squalene synthase HpnC